MLILNSCTDAGNQPEPEPEEGLHEAVEETSLREIPGLHLLYTVNDPLAYTFTDDLTAHVLISEPDGSRREILFNYPGYIYHISPSPSGTEVAFVGSVKAQGGKDEHHLFLYDLQSDQYWDVSISGLYSRAVKTGPIFTPDGKYVLFLSRWTLDAGDFNVFKCEVDSGFTSGLYTEPVEDVPLTLMPGGEKCIAVRRIRNVPGVLEYIAINIETGAAELLHHFDDVTKIGPAHVVENGSVLYCDKKPSETSYSVDIGSHSREVIAIDLTSGSETTLLGMNTVNYMYQVFTSMKGVPSLLIRRQEASEGEEPSQSRIAVCNTDGTNFRYLIDTSAPAYLFGKPPVNLRHLSPDNSLLFFYRQDPLFEHEDIWVMNSDGSDPLNVSDTAGYTEGSAGWIVIPGG